MSKTKTFLTSFSVLFFITVFEKLMAFVFEALIAAKFGAGEATDSYFTVAEFFTLVDAAFVSALVIVALNRYTRHISSSGEKAGFQYLSELLSFYFPVLALLSVLILFGARPLSYVIAPGFGTGAREAVVRCTRFMSVIPPLFCLACIGCAVLRQKKLFEITGLKSLFISVVGIGGIFAGSCESVRRGMSSSDILSISYVVSIVLYCCLVLAVVRKYGRLAFGCPRFTRDVRESLSIMFPLMMSYGIARLALMIDKVIASTLQTGSVSALTYAHSLYKVVGAIFVTNLATVILTDFNNLCARNEVELVKSKLKRTLSMMSLVLIPITMVSVFCAEDIVRVIYERGKFHSSASHTVGSVLLFYALNFVPVMVQGVYNQVLYSFGDTLRPMKISLVAVVINLGTSIPLTMTIGLSGVAIGTVVSTVVASALGLLAVRNYLPGYKSFLNMEFVCKCALAGCIAVSLLWIVPHVSAHPLIRFLVSAAIGFLSFWGCLLLFREDNLVYAATNLYGRFVRRLQQNPMAPGGRA